MNQPLRVLYLEENPAYCQLVQDMLAREGLSVVMTLVTRRPDFVKQLRQSGWDLILADYRVPGWSGLEALKMVREQHGQLPFILFSSSVGEQAAAESLKAGATDYVLKQNRERLAPAVRRAVSEISERVRREQVESELHQSEHQYQLLFQSNPHPMWVFDFETQRIMEVNEAAVAHYGYSREEFLTMTLSDLRVPERSLLPHTPSRLQMDTESQGVVWRHRRKNGTFMDMEVVWWPLAFRGRLAALAMAMDATARRRTFYHNAVFGKLTHQLSAVTSPATAAKFICEAADELFHWDNFALDLYSVAKNEVVSLLAITTVEGRRVEIPDLPQPNPANALVERVAANGAELVPAEEAGGLPGATMIAPIRKGISVIGVLFIQSGLSGSYSGRDLNTLQALADQCSGALERIRAEEELRHSQRRFRELFESSPDAIFVEDMTGAILDVNRNACLMHGLSREDLIGKNAVEMLTPPDHREAGHKNFHRLADGQLSWLETENLRADGRLIPVEVRVVHVEFDGEPALLFHVRDISERRAAEMALRSSETLFRSVWENSVDGLRLTDHSGTIVAVNEAFCRLVGLPHQQLEGRPLAVIYSGSTDWERLLQEHRENFLSGFVQGRHVTECVLHDSRSMIFEITDSFVESGGEPRLLLSLFRDITTQRKLEDQLRQAQKMEAIGQLAGGIAHDFNNILTIILGHATILTMQSQEPKLVNSAKQIRQASERAAGLTRQLLAFGRKQIASTRPLDLNQLVSNMAEMLRRLLGEDVVLNIQFSETPAIIEADASMMEQVLLNLSVNSRDAMPRGGQLSIGVSQQDVDEHYTSQMMEARPGRFICLTHADTGVGIPPENLTRIFEPFFTTKELGKGTGLGLATVFGIVKQHKGWIEVESHINQGTQFKIFFPAAQQTTVDDPSSDTKTRRRGGTETILVVEDERDLRDLVCRVLRNDGYRVFEAVDGQSALEIWKEYKGRIDLVFTDVIMPGGLNGRELAEKFWAERPQLKVIFSSGYGANTLGKDFKLDARFNYLQKPYEPEKLAKTIRRCLDAKQA